jgi:hypothetical protein
MSRWLFRFLGLRGAIMGSLWTPGIRLAMVEG